MATINFTVEDHNIRADNQIELAQASNNYDSCKFTFDSSWSGFTLYAVMYQDPKNVFKKQLDSSNTCKIPAEVLKKSGYIYIGARGEKADKTIATSVLFKMRVLNGAVDGNETGQEILNESQYEYLLGKINKLSDDKIDKNGITLGTDPEDGLTYIYVDGKKTGDGIDVSSSGGIAVVRYTVTNNLTNVTSSNNSGSVVEGKSYTATLSANENYILGTPVITMNGINVTSDSWDANTNTINIAIVTGDIVISCTGIESVDTSARIAQYGYGLRSNGSTVENGILCYTDFYDIPDGYTGKISALIPYDDDTSGWNPQSTCSQIFEDDTFKTYWSTGNIYQKDGVGGEPLTIGLYYASSWPANKFRITLITKYLDESYAYFTDTGDIIFAGANTPYYGMTNINGTTAGDDSGGSSNTNVADSVDNAVMMLSLTTGETVDTSAYSGLSSDYVSMVQSNYDAMMSECLGDYNKIPIIVHTDQHGRIGATNSVMKLIGDMVNWYEISKCINLGDTVSGTFNSDILQNYLDATKDSIPLSKRLDVYGNHDVWDSDDNQKYTVNQKRLSPYFKNIYAHRHGNNGYFTVIDDYYNVKYLVISDLEYPDTNYPTRRITTAQSEFIVSELSADDGRDIVIVSHVPLDSDDVISRDSDYTAYSEKFLSDTTAHNSFMTMLAARKNKTGGTFTDSEGVDHTYDFSSVSGNLLMSLHGHAHFEAYRTFENSITEFMFDWFNGNTFYFGYIDRKNKKFKCWKNETGVDALEISIA